MEQHKLKGKCTLFHYSRCAAEMAIAAGYKATASGLAEQRERGPPEVWNVAEERWKRSKLPKGLGEVQRAEVPVPEILAG